jgi:hypothetical protein
MGSLALAPAPAMVPLPDVGPRTEPRIDPNDRVIHTGFAALDAILGPGGLPRNASVAIRGDGSSGRTTLVHRLAAEAQDSGSIVAWLDLSRSFDPVEAVARGIRLDQSEDSEPHERCAHDECDEQRVLDERGATFALDVGLDPGVQELVVRDHFRVDSLCACPARLRWPLSVLH